jgi:hypothetical protein
MNASKKIVWSTAAIAAAALFSGAARADYRGDHNSRGRNDEHRRVWRNHSHHYYDYEHRYVDRR